MEFVVEKGDVVKQDLSLETSPTGLSIRSNNGENSVRLIPPQAAGDVRELSISSDKIRQWRTEGVIKLKKVASLPEIEDEVNGWTIDLVRTDLPDKFCYRKSVGDKRYEILVWKEDKMYKGTLSTEGESGRHSFANKGGLTSAYEIVKKWMEDEAFLKGSV